MRSTTHRRAREPDRRRLGPRIASTRRAGVCAADLPDGGRTDQSTSRSASPSAATSGASEAASPEPAERDRRFTTYQGRCVVQQPDQTLARLTIATHAGRSSSLAPDVGLAVIERRRIAARAAAALTALSALEGVEPARSRIVAAEPRHEHALGRMPIPAKARLAAMRSERAR